MLTEIQQIHKQIDRAKRILITFRRDGAGDAISSAVALLLFLERMGKRADIIVDNFSLPRQLAFLKKAGDIRPAFPHLQKFILTIDVAKTGVEELSYDVKEDKLRVFVTPKQGVISRNDVRVARSDYTYDTIITLDTRDLSSLGRMYHEHADFFFAVPIVNIDHHAANDFFGTVNAVDTTRASTSEVLFHVLVRLGEEHMTEDVASALLTGMIAKTHSFKTNNIRPHTLALAAKLMSLGADRERIVHNLYQSRSIRTLKLWGYALQNLHTEAGTGLVWSTLTREDFARSGANEEDLYDVVDELIGNAPEAKLTLLIHEHTRQPRIHVILNSHGSHDAKRLLHPYAAKGNAKRATCLVEGKTLKDIEDDIVAHIKKQLH